MNGVLTSSRKLDFRTPGDFLQHVREIDPIVLDPAGHRRSLVDAEHTIYPPRGWKKTPARIAGGLAKSWIDIAGKRGLSYVNPPYGRHVKAWAEKMVAEAAAGAHIFALVASRTDTLWFQGMATATPRPLILLVRGRLTYIGEKDPAPFPNAVIYWGPTEQKRRKFVRVFGDAGLVVRVP
jgi:site-specific DNA-methyltransferase (adenine-specific)